MKAASILVIIPGLLLCALGIAAAEQEHKIPDAPPEYLAMENPIKEDEVDKKFLKKVGKLYHRKCRKCHGEKGDGKGPNAENFIIKPAAFSKPGYLASRKDGQLFWIMMNGSEGTEMAPVGPYSDEGLSEEQLWQLIVYLRKTFTR